MYLRFKTSFLDDCRESQYGVFQAAHFLLGDMMCLYEQERLNEIWNWFRLNLPEPAVYKQKKNNAHIICWFKSTATVHLQKMYEMIEILEQYSVFVSLVKSSKPGYIIYEDADQVAAIPFTKLVRQVR